MGGGGGDGGGGGGTTRDIGSRFNNGAEPLGEYLSKRSEYLSGSHNEYIFNGTFRYVQIDQYIACVC